ncbi:MAG: hypothetical protein DCO98_01115 [Altererythrobacter sp. XM-24bin4]|nr:MAG: hypothetical protein DCO98_01115 [Altererythrobacter sp. XM-24bin4]
MSEMHLLIHTQLHRRYTRMGHWFLLMFIPQKIQWNRPLLGKILTSVGNLFLRKWQRFAVLLKISPRTCL